MRIFACFLLVTLLAAAPLASGAFATGPPRGSLAPGSFYRVAPDRGSLYSPYSLPDRHFYSLDRQHRLHQPESLRRFGRPLSPGDLRRYDLHWHQDLGLHDHRHLLEHDRHIFGGRHHFFQPHQKYLLRDRNIVCYRAGSVLVCQGG